MLGPRHLQRLARLIGLIPTVSDDRDAGHQSLQVGRSLDDERVLHAGHRLDLIEIGRSDLRTEDGRLLIHRPQHAGHGEVDAEHRFAGRDRGSVYAAHRLADDLVVLWILQRHHAQRRHRFGRSGCGQLAVPNRALG